MPYVVSMQSTKHGGFLFFKECKITSSNGSLLTVSVERKINGNYEIDDNYEVYPEQVFDTLPNPYQNHLFKRAVWEQKFQNVIDLRTGERINPYQYSDFDDKWPCNWKAGDKVWVHSRQIWDGVLPNRIKATVFQKQIGKSVIVSSGFSNNRNEFYDFQIEKRIW